jgi:hypothetical protein
MTMSQPRSGANPPIDAVTSVPLPLRDEDVDDMTLREHDQEEGYCQRGMDRLDPETA